MGKVNVLTADEGVLIEFILANRNKSLDACKRALSKLTGKAHELAKTLIDEVSP